MIREVTPHDADAITAIYNEYILHSTISFETEPLTPETMRDRIVHIADHYPYFVAEEAGTVVGYCYAHPWKERAAYGHTLETTVYLSPRRARTYSAKQKGCAAKRSFALALRTPLIAAEILPCCRENRVSILSLSP